MSQQVCYFYLVEGLDYLSPDFTTYRGLVGTRGNLGFLEGGNCGALQPVSKGGEGRKYSRFKKWHEPRSSLVPVSLVGTQTETVTMCL